MVENKGFEDFRKEHFTCGIHGIKVYATTNKYETSMDAYNSIREDLWEYANLNRFWHCYEHDVSVLLHFDIEEEEGIDRYLDWEENR